MARPVAKRHPQRPSHHPAAPAPALAPTPAHGPTLRDVGELVCGLAWMGGVAWIVLAYFGVV